uniref:Serine/arginine-rich-splicing factor SR34-like n=1 Tax=Rhizophora mucronata TaxID=61149 RepID=A0A2P2LV03_RHIMU
MSKESHVSIQVNNHYVQKMIVKCHITHINIKLKPSHNILGNGDYLDSERGFNPEGETDLDPDLAGERRKDLFLGDLLWLLLRLTLRLRLPLRPLERDRTLLGLLDESRLESYSLTRTYARENAFLNSESSSFLIAYFISS